ncbi:MAG: vitamin B12 dependent-methionine synthase activation domain-containing protein [Candidatus Omnitrophota bacterium]
MGQYHGKIDWDRVRLNLLKYEKICNVKKPYAKKSILACINKCLKLAKSRAVPKIIVIKKRIAGIGASIRLDSGLELSTRQISSLLKGASHLYLIAVTIGPSLEKTATEYMNEGDLLCGYIMDRIGSFACESLAEFVEEDLRNACMCKGLSVSMRFSPGYCDFPIEEQFKLNRELDFSKIGISINKSCMMIPKKSITAIVGIGPKGLFKKKRSQCLVCGKKDCSYKRQD